LKYRFDSVFFINLTGFPFLILGAGISEENQKRLFNEIVQFNPEVLQAGGGSGLGLWITRGIVDLHNSTISVFSAGELVS
jgi:signal transduction histidine kinase